ncbi:type II toxin-antitoxin system RelB/DinJ family antitoxin [Peptoniphilus grossensis]|uniref:type II toxin-antitoxin system RelB/DinJ family antitoxin n=2 Tax=Peptoniphilus grossensis TaxID=1465756 RepID=UPI00030B2BD6|nr:type II toxin-antitoxin system RelB/DinJ family antitoxin [Peptoniphilus grossensis]
MNKGETMANVNIRIEENLKNEFEKVCESMGMTRDEAFEIFARAVVEEGKIPFDVEGNTIIAEFDDIESFKNYTKNLW